MFQNVQNITKNVIITCNHVYIVTVTRLYSRADNSRLAPQGSCMLGNVYFYAPWQEKYTLVKLCKSTILGFPSIVAFYY